MRFLCSADFPDTCGLNCIEVPAADGLRYVDFRVKRGLYSAHVPNRTNSYSAKDRGLYNS